ncbi:MAG: hypothetical protein K2W95_32755 [Candidatus Obscuribacterales bacterium]|nr:hypothetical protein [Candidatus Obscuribacterales bacterium]
MKSFEPVTLEDLQSGRVARISAKQLSKLAGCSEATLARKRWLGTGIAFTKDPESGAVHYMAADVLTYLLRPTHKATVEYGTHQLGNLERARAERAAKRAAL